VFRGHGTDNCPRSHHVIKQWLALLVTKGAYWSNNPFISSNRHQVIRSLISSTSRIFNESDFWLAPRWDNLTLTLLELSGNTVDAETRARCWSGVVRHVTNQGWKFKKLVAEGKLSKEEMIEEGRFLSYHLDQVAVRPFDFWIIRLFLNLNYLRKESLLVHKRRLFTHFSSSYIVNLSISKN
jgi:hypothetical protein